MTEDEFDAYQGSTDILSSDTIISIEGTDDKFMANGVAGEVVPLFTNRLQKTANGKFKTANTGVEYISNNQYGGIYGTVYIQFHNALANGSTIITLGITNLIAFGGIFDNYTCYNGYESDGISKINFSRTLDSITAYSTGWNITSGWVEYTK